MRKKRDHSDLPIDERIGKLKRNIEFYLLFGIVFNTLVAILGVVLIVCVSELKYGIGILCTIPVSLFLGVYIQTKVDKEEIKKLEEQKAENEKQEKKAENE